jgi:hypothetical protein
VPNPLHYSHRSSLETLNPVHESFIGAAYIRIGVIYVTFENANGVVKTYYRKANASGVATFTLRFKGTFEVTASYGDAITDTVTLKK